MRQLLPEPTEIDPVSAHAAAARPVPPGRPWFAINMVSSLDGATAIDGVSGQLGGPGDKVVFRAIRGFADAIVVAAGTVRAERYGPPRTTPEVQARRVERGQTPFPRMVILTATLDLDETSSLFTEAPEPPLIVTVASAPADRRAALEPCAEIRTLGEGRLDVAEVALLLGSLGIARAVVEGGPDLNGQLIAAGLVDEIDLTLSPMLVGGSSRRVALGDHELVAGMELAHLWEIDGFLFARYVRATAAP